MGQMEEPKEALKKFSESVEQFSAAADRLLLAWEKLHDADTGISADVSLDYPFHKDFMELSMDIHGWKHTLRKMVKFGFPGPREWLPKRPRE